MRPVRERAGSAGEQSAASAIRGVHLARRRMMRVSVVAALLAFAGGSGSGSSARASADSQLSARSLGLVLPALPPARLRLRSRSAAALSPRVPLRQRCAWPRAAQTDTLHREDVAVEVAERDGEGSGDGGSGSEMSSTKAFLRRQGRRWAGETQKWGIGPARAATNPGIGTGADDLAGVRAGFAVRADLAAFLAENPRLRGDVHNEISKTSGQLRPKPQRPVVPEASAGTGAEAGAGAVAEAATAAGGRAVPGPRAAPAAGGARRTGGAELVAALQRVPRPQAPEGHTGAGQVVASPSAEMSAKTVVKAPAPVELGSDAGVQPAAAQTKQAMGAAVSSEDGPSAPAEEMLRGLEEVGLASQKAKPPLTEAAQNEEGRGKVRMQAGDLVGEDTLRLGELVEGVDERGDGYTVGGDDDPMVMELLR